MRESNTLGALRVVGYFLESHSEMTCGELSELKREYLVNWLVKPSLNGNTVSVMEFLSIKDSQVSLAVDCLIAAGIGRNGEQNETVYGGYSYYD